MKPLLHFALGFVTCLLILKAIEELILAVSEPYPLFGGKNENYNR